MAAVLVDSLVLKSPCLEIFGVVLICKNLGIACNIFHTVRSGFTNCLKDEKYHNYCETRRIIYIANALSCACQMYLIIRVPSLHVIVFYYQ